MDMLNKNKILTIFICVITAVALVVGIAVSSRAIALKADEELPETPVIIEDADYNVSDVQDASADVPQGDGGTSAVEEDHGNEFTQEIVIQYPEETADDTAAAPEDIPADPVESGDAAPAEPENVPAEEAAEPSEETDTASEPTEDGTDYAEPSEETENPPEEAAPEIDLSKLKVEIKSDRREIMTPGEEVHLKGILTGFDGIDYTLRWECDKHDGNGFMDVPGADGTELSFTASAASLAWTWRLAVDF